MERGAELVEERGAAFVNEAFCGRKRGRSDRCRILERQKNPCLCQHSVAMCSAINALCSNIVIATKDLVPSQDIDLVVAVLVERF